MFYLHMIYKIVKRINNNIGASRFYIFLDISPDKVWNQKLLYKIKNSFPTDLYAIIRSYLIYRTFRVKYEEVVTKRN